MKPSKIGFSVIYRWRIRGGMEESFQVAWETITQALMANRGAHSLASGDRSPGWRMKLFLPLDL